MRKKYNDNQIGKVIFGLSALAGATTIAYFATKNLTSMKKQRDKMYRFVDYGDKQVYFIGGGLASLAGAAYLIRDCNFKGENIHIIEATSKLGGSNDGAGEDVNGFICRGGRMLNEETYENFWELFSSIPSLEMPGKSVTEEILNFDSQHPTNAKARLIDKNGNILNVKSMGFDNKDCLALGRLIKIVTHTCYFSDELVAKIVSI